MKSEYITGAAVKITLLSQYNFEQNSAVYPCFAIFEARFEFYFKFGNHMDNMFPLFLLIWDLPFKSVKTMDLSMLLSIQV